MRRHHSILAPAALALALALVVSPPAARSVDRSRLVAATKEDFLTGTWGGRRLEWAKRGIDLGFTYTAAAYENLSGGLACGGAVEGTADLNFACDLGKLAGWRETRFHVSAVAGHGTSISTKSVGDVNKISNYYNDPGLYLHEVWLERGWLDNRLTLRVGKLSLDMAFPVYNYADTLTAPLYPTGGLGARLHYEPDKIWFFDLAAYDGDPNEPGLGVNRHGLRVRLARHEGATLAGMVGFNHSYGENAPLPPGTWKAGAYHNTRDHADVRTGARHRGNHAFFLNGDQTLWRENPKVKDDVQGLALYLVAEVAPPDRNTYHYGYGGGPFYTGLLPGRDADVLYLSLLYTRFSARHAAASRAAGGPDYTSEARWQLNYQIAVRKFFSLTPELSYVSRPGGTGGLRDATVLGLRTTLTF